MTTKSYELILFGVTGFTGKLAAEYLLTKQYDLKWATCARNKAKAETILKDIADKCTLTEVPQVLEANLICDSEEQVETLRGIVQQTKLVITCAGPFEKYGQTLLKLCAEEGVHYADITGESDFVRKMIHEHDAKARETGACIISHCGNDCVPQDLCVYEMHTAAAEKSFALESVETFVELAESAAFSGGTAATLAFQMRKDRSQRSTDFDPLLMDKEGNKSEYTTKNISPKSNQYSESLQQTVGPWVMAPVMVNCVRRSNAILHYSEELKYGDSQIQNVSAWGTVKNTAMNIKVAVAIKVPFLQGLLPKPGEGPSREDMEEGYMTLHARGTIKSKDNSDETKKIKAKFHFGKDVAYLYTAAILVETGMCILQTKDKPSGVVTPAVALGHGLTERLCEKLDISLEVEIED